VSKKKFIAAGAALGVVATLFATAPAANAEPIANGPAIVGSDTLQDVVNALVNGTQVTTSDVRSTARSIFASSFDATGSVTIQTKSQGPRFGRPNGSSDGVKALSRSIQGTGYSSATPGSPTNVIISGQVDVARSSSGASTVADGLLLYIPFGRDALTYAHNGGSNVAFDTLDGPTLKGIYECTITTVGGVTVNPVIPQAGSGTRKDFLAAIGSNEAGMKELTETGGCVAVGQEHDTSALATNAITPMSAAQWVAQNTGAGVDRRGAGVKLGSPVAGQVPVLGTGSAAVPNPDYYSNSTWGRNTFIVVENARVTSGDVKYDANLANLVSNATDKLGNIQSTLNAQAGKVKLKFGFLAPSVTTPNRAAITP